MQGRVALAAVLWAQHPDARSESLLVRYAYKAAGLSDADSSDGAAATSPSTSPSGWAGAGMGAQACTLTGDSGRDRRLRQRHTFVTAPDARHREPNAS